MTLPNLIPPSYEEVRYALDVLGLPSGADREAVIRAWRDAVRRWHPDLAPLDASASERDAAESYVRRVNSAKQVALANVSYRERFGASPGDSPHHSLVAGLVSGLDAPRPAAPAPRPVHDDWLPPKREVRSTVQNANGTARRKGDRRAGVRPLAAVGAALAGVAVLVTVALGLSATTGRTVSRSSPATSMQTVADTSSLADGVRDGSIHATDLDSVPAPAPADAVRDFTIAVGTRSRSLLQSVLDPAARRDDVAAAVSALEGNGAQGEPWCDSPDDGTATCTLPGMPRRLAVHDTASGWRVIGWESP